MKVIAGEALLENEIADAFSGGLVLLASAGSYLLSGGSAQLTIQGAQPSYGGGIRSDMPIHWVQNPLRPKRRKMRRESELMLFML